MITTRAFQRVRERGRTVVTSASWCGTTSARTMFWWAKGQRLPPAAQASPAGTNGDCSGSAYEPAHSSVSEGNELVEMDGGADELEWVRALIEDVLQQVPPRIPPLSIGLCRGVLSSKPSTASARPSDVGGKDMNALIAACQRKEEERGKRLAKYKRR